MPPEQTVTALDTFIELSEFGILANSTDDLDLLLERACRTASHALGTEMAKILERVPENETALYIKTLYGFTEEPESKIIDIKGGSAAAYALLSKKPVVTEDIKQETRFQVSEVEAKNDVQSMANVVIPGAPGKPDYGVLEVDNPRPYHFEKKDVYFLQAYASFIAAAIARLNAKRELEESYKKLDDFAHIVSHDLKEPLRAIANYSSFLLEDYKEKLDEEGKKNLEMMQRLSIRMTNLISDLLRYSRAGKEETKIEKAPIGEIVNNILESLDLKIKEKNILVKVGSGFPTIICSRVSMTEIFRNLIENGIKYNNSAQKELEIGYLTNHKKNPRGYVFFVKDNGIGIPEKHHKDIFEIFKRLHKKDEYEGGTGSGLAIVKKLVDQYNGDIWVESKEGEGSTFYFYLDCAKI
jgi:signal transduction histidine kinase